MFPKFYSQNVTCWLNLYFFVGLYINNIVFVIHYKSYKYINLGFVVRPKCDVLCYNIFIGLGIGIRVGL
jgi:hypothetical protein